MKNIFLTAIAIILIITAAIRICQFLLPLFAIASIICLVLLIISYFFFSDDFYPIAVAFILCLGGVIVTYGIGYSFGESNLGNAITTSADAFNQIEEAQDEAMIMVIEGTESAISYNNNDLTFKRHIRNIAIITKNAIRLF